MTYIFRSLQYAIELSTDICRHMTAAPNYAFVVSEFQKFRRVLGILKQENPRRRSYLRPSIPQLRISVLLTDP